MRWTGWALVLIAWTGCGGPVELPDGGPGPEPDAGPPAVDAGRRDAQPEDAAASDAGAASDLCMTGGTCSVPLAPDGTCPGVCVAAPPALACRAPARVAFGVCFGNGDVRDPLPVSRDGVRIEIVSLPVDAFPGEEHELHLRITNERDAPLTTTAQVSTGIGWTILEELQPLRDVTLAPSTSADLRLRMRAFQSTILSPTSWAIARVTLTNTSWSGRGHQIDLPVLSNEGDIACGAQRFPSYLPAVEGSVSGYDTARCVDGVFFPGASCVDGRECPSGVCADGVCIDRAPFLPWAESPLAGRHRVLVVLADQDLVAPAADPCADRSEELRELLRLDEPLGWIEDVVAARAGRAGPVFRVEVLAGFDTDTFLPGAGARVPHAQWVDALERHLVELGCIESFGAQAGRVVTVSARSDAGSRVTQVGRANLQEWHRWVFLHELLHTFGATDLYYRLGSMYQWSGALMTHASRAPSLGEGEAVTWAEMGLADLDRDGVIDTFARPRGESLHLEAVDAVVARGRSLAVSVPIQEERDGVRYRVWPHDVVLELPDYGIVRRPRELDFDPGATRVSFVFLPDEVDLDAIVAAGTLRVRLRAVRGFDDDAFERHTIALDETRDARISVR